jgi:hypothetical protein
MASVVVNGREYRLRFDLYAMEQIEEEFGSVKNVFDTMQNGKQVKATKTLFRILANSALSYAGEKESVTGDEIKHADMDMIREISEAVKQAVNEGHKSETTHGGEADDEVHDIYLEEIERKN